MREASRAFVLVVGLALAALAAPPALPQSGTIEEIEVLGLFRMDEGAFLHLLGVNEGDPYDTDQLRRRFKAVWKRGLFDDIVFEAEPGASGGMILVIKLKERPVLQSVDYGDSKAVTRTEIEDRLREREVQLKIGRPVDMGAIYNAKTVIRDMLGEKGYLDAGVDVEIQTITETSRAVLFSMRTGGKTRVKKIRFEGNETFSDRKLRGQLQLTQQRKWYWPWSKKNLYHPAKWDQDVQQVRALYQNNGYLDVEIRPPAVNVLGKKGEKRAIGEGGTDTVTETVVEPAPEPDVASMTAKERQQLAKQERKQLKKQQKGKKKQEKKKTWVELSAPVSEGDPYTVGEITVVGNEVFQDELIKALVGVRPDQVFRNNQLDQGIERITRLYEDRGHLYASVVGRVLRREDDDIADVEVTVDEDEPYYISRIEFTGNTNTKDRVIRRELLVAEGELFNRTRLEFSRAKVNQLGYFSVPAEPVIEPVEGEKHVNVTFNGQETGRNEIQIGGGYSGVDGPFFNGVYSTRNFLGRGQILSVAMQIGGRSNNFQISFQEPWFLGKPIRAGFSVFRRSTDFGSTLQSKGSGFGLILGKRLGPWGNINLSYNFEQVESTTVLTPIGGVTDNVTGVVVSTNTVSSLTPVWSINTINNPYRPSAGRNLIVSFQIAGGPLGGDTSFLKPIVRYTKYFKAPGKAFLGVHAQGGLVRSWAGGTTIGNANIQGVPRFQRFWLGGDTLGPRTFETRSITPLRYVVLNDTGGIGDVIGDPRYVSAEDLVTSLGQPALIEVGGDRFYLLQTEYVWPLNEQAEIAMFLDMGDALFEDTRLNLNTIRVSAGFEVRFHLPIFPVPLRLIYGWPLHELPSDRTANFTFSIGRSF